ncbi:MAG: alpha/beta hydrolase [Pseudomonadota bacterium]
MTDTISVARRASRVVLIHCSGSAPAQWAQLEACLAPQFEPHSVTLTGHGDRAPWGGERVLSLAEEARDLAATIGGEDAVHIVGHSYGGAVAFRYALKHPARVRSLTLFEPALFDLLRFDPDESAALDEIEAVAKAVSSLVLLGDYRSAMARFVDYWNGAGAWSRMPETLRAELSAKALLVAHHFAALLEPGPSPSTFEALGIPLLVLCGTDSPKSARAVSRVLAKSVFTAKHRTIGHAGHMAPVTHPDRVNPVILDALRTADQIDATPNSLVG